MNDPSVKPNCGALRTWSACLWLGLLLGLAFPPLAVWAYSQSGADGVCAAAVAGGVNAVAAGASLALVGWLRSGPWAIQGILGGVLVRMLVPLAAGVLLTQSGGALANAGVFGMIVLYYLIGLVVETLLAVRLIQASAVQAARAG